MNSVAAEIHVSGRVQGVGYRYYSFQKAKHLELVGWVKNNPDGSVQLFVEGDRGGIEVLINALKIGPPASSVALVKHNWLPYSGKIKSFEITY